MKRCALALLGLTTACSSGGGSQGEAADASTRDASSEASTLEGCADAGVPPGTLEGTGLYADFVTKEVAPDALAYTPAYPLWSDGAQKSRWIMLPPSTTIDDSNPDEWT